MLTHASAAASVLALLATGCPSGPIDREPPHRECPELRRDCIVIPRGQAIRLGTLLATSGESASLGIDSERGVELALEERGLVAGRRVELVKQDERCSADGGSTGAANLAADDRLVAVIGTSCSDAAATAMRTFDRRNVMLVSPMNTSPRLTSPKPGVRFYARTAHNDRVQGDAVGRFAHQELGSNTAVAVTDGMPDANALAGRFKAVFERLGGSASIVEVPHADETTVRSALAEVGTPDVLLFPWAKPERAAALVRAARSIPALSQTELIGSDMSFTTGFIEAAGRENALGVRFSGPDLTGSDNSPGYGAFLRRFESRYDEEPQSVFHAHAYDAANIVLDALEQVAIINNRTGELHASRLALREEILSTKNHEGLTGRLTCDRWGDCAAPVRICLHRIAPAEVDDPGWCDQPR